MVSNKLKWKSDFDKPVLWQNFERRGWTKGDESKLASPAFDRVLKMTGISFGRTPGPSNRRLTQRLGSD